MKHFCSIQWFWLYIMKIEFIKLTNKIAKILTVAFEKEGQNEPLMQFKTYIKEEKLGLRKVIVARYGDFYLGYVTVVWRSSNAVLRKKNCPEIRDLNVMPKYRNQGVGRALLHAVQAELVERYKYVGLAVEASDKALVAQQLYLKEGFTKITPKSVEHLCTLQYEDMPDFKPKQVYWMIKNLR